MASERNYSHQPVIPGLDGPEWDSPQPELPIVDNLTNKEKLGVLDTLQDSIVDVEQSQKDLALADTVLYEMLMELAEQRGLLPPQQKYAQVELEAKIAEINESLNNPKGMNTETEQELKNSLATMLAEYHELN